MDAMRVRVGEQNSVTNAYHTIQWITQREKKKRYVTQSLHGQSHAHIHVYM